MGNPRFWDERPRYGKSTSTCQRSENRPAQRRQEASIPTEKLAFGPASPGPRDERVGGRKVEKLLLPRPPRPPRATTTRSSECEKSWIFSPVSSSYRIVPTGTFRITAPPSRPVLFAPSP